MAGLGKRGPGQRLGLGVRQVDQHHLQVRARRGVGADRRARQRQRPQRPAHGQVQKGRQADAGDAGGNLLPHARALSPE